MQRETIKRICTLYLLLTYVNAKLLVPGLYPGTYVVDGDIKVGILVDIYKDGPRSAGRHCPDPDFSTIKLTNIQLCEAAVFAANQINMRSDLLPNVSLGVVCTDMCDDPLTALARSVYLVEDHLGSEPVGDQIKAGLNHEKIVGVIGPTNNDDAVLVSSFLGLFHIPVLGTYTTSDELSDKTRYEYFLRLAPPDRFQAQALIDLVLHFGWKYLGLIYSEGSYGEYGAKQILSLVDQHNLCLAYSYRISLYPKIQEQKDVIELFEKNPNLKVVVWFAEGKGLQNVFEALASKYPSPTVIHLFSYMSGYMPVLFPDATVGCFLISTTIAPVPGFLEYFTNLVPGNNTENTWMKTVWEKSFDCDWSPNGNNTCSSYHPEKAFYGYIPIITPYYDGMYVYAHALEKVISNNCPYAFVNKTLLADCIQGSDLLIAMKNLTIESASGVITFNEDGDMLGKYKVVQRHKMEDSLIHSITLGFWDKLKGNIDLDESQVDLKLFNTSDDPKVGVTRKANTGGDVFIPYSVCSWPCAPNEFLIAQKVSCCWECRKCRDNEVVINGTSCEECPLFTWPNSDTGYLCVSISPTFMLWTDPISISLTFFAVIGMVGITAVSIAMWKKRSAKLVKASSKELSVLILLGGFLACLSTLSFISKPTKLTCLLRSLGFNFSVTLLYCPMFVKTWRVYRIFSHGKKGLKRPRFISTMAQIVMTALCILGQVVLLTCLENISPSDTMLNMPAMTDPYVELTCSQHLVPFLLPVIYNVIFIVVCAALGYQSRKLPENFNESGFIFLSVATTLFAWVVFLPTYFTAVYSHNQMAILSLCLLLNAYINVGCLFGPKVYALHYMNETELKFVPMTKTVPLSVVSSSNALTVRAATSTTFGQNR